MLELSDLRTFARIADVGSLSGAARALRMPKSSVSRSLVRLEDAVGTGLVVRSTRHLRLTDAGLMLRGHARRILAEVAEAEDAVGGLSGEARGDLRVTAPFTFTVGPIAAMMPRFAQRYPKVRVAITVDNRIVDVVGEDYDVAVRIGALADSALIARRLTEIGMRLCASPDYLARSAPVRVPADLQGHLLLSYGYGAEPWRFRDANGALAGLPLEARIIVQEPDAILAMVAGGTGIGLLPDFTAAAGLRDGRLVRLLPELDLGSVPAHALFPSHRGLSPKVRVFIDALVEHLA